VNKGCEVLLVRDQQVDQNFRKAIAQFVRLTRLVERGSGPELLNSSRIPKCEMSFSQIPFEQSIG
jgi:hypothetical protein